MFTPKLQIADTPEGDELREVLAVATEQVAWMPKWMGGDGRLEEAMELWYKAHPSEDPRINILS